MAGGVRLTRGRGWLAVAAVLALGSVAAWWLPAAALDWQPALAAAEPWRAWTGAWVHWSVLHLQANLAGLLAVAALGAAAALPGRLALAWLAAWPLTQCGLLVRPELAHYGGLSGVLHAGAVAAALGLLAGAGDDGGRRTRRRLVGGALLVAIATKLLLEAPWGPALRRAAGWDIALAPVAHASGAAAGLLCAGLVLLWSGRRRRRRPGVA